MPKISSGILLYKNHNNALEVLLVHMGGPFWTKKDAGSWSIPKGEVLEGEDLLETAKREFVEELGSPAPQGEYQDLGELKQKGGKVVHAFAVEGNWQGPLKSNMFTLEWPPRSGTQQEFPEVDRAEWFSPEEAHTKILKSQLEFLNRLLALPALIDGRQ